MTTEPVTTIKSSKIVGAVRQTTSPKFISTADKAMQLAYFLTIIETMLSEGSPRQVSYKDLTEFVALAREKADALYLALKH